MLSLIFRRVQYSIVLLTLASVLCFALVVSAPGNVAVLIAELRSPRATVEDVRKIEDEIGLRNPLPIRYYHWLSNAIRGDFGVSYKTGDKVGEALAERLSTTATLIFGGSVVGLALSFGLGFAGARWPYGGIDRLTRGLALLGASTPSFFVGAMLIYAFAVVLRWLPSFGFDGLASWILPWFTIGLLPAAVLSRIVRVGLEDAMSRPFAITARSKGFSRQVILFRDALPIIAPTFINAWGTQTALMVVGSIVVEPLFAWQGVGDLFLTGVRFRDFMVVQACLLIFITFFIVLNLLVDIATMLVDPKLRRQGA